MLKLIKYELLKQKTSKIIILGILAVLEVFYMAGILMDKENVWGIATMFLAFLMIGTFLVVGLEAIVTYSHDLRDKSGYMLFMTPHSAYEIMGSKILCSIISIVIAVLLFLLVGFLDLTVALAKYGELQNFLDQLRLILNEVYDIQIDWNSVVTTIVMTVFSWIGTVTSAFLAITLCKTLIAGVRGRGFISFILFWIINIGAEVFNDKIIALLNIQSAYGEMIEMTVFTVIYAGLCFFITGYILQRELSL